MPDEINKQKHEVLKSCTRQELIGSFLLHGIGFWGSGTTLIVFSQFSECFLLKGESFRAIVRLR